MSWSPAYFAAGEILQGTFRGFFFNLINIAADEIFAASLSNTNDNPAANYARVAVNIVSNSEINMTASSTTNNLYVGQLVVTDKNDINHTRRIVWVNTTKPLPTT